MVRIGDYYYDFAEMLRYRWVDWQNFNIKRKDCALEIRLVNSKICDYDVFKKQWVPIHKSSYIKNIVDEAYQNWLAEEIEKIVL